MRIRLMLVLCEDVMVVSVDLGVVIGVRVCVCVCVCVCASEHMCVHACELRCKCALLILSFRGPHRTLNIRLFCPKY